MNNIFLDIETVPSDEQWVQNYVRETLSPPGNIKKQDSIDKWWAEKSEDALQEKLEKCSFDGAMNNIVCIGCAFDNDAVETFSVTKSITEAAMLEAFFEYIVWNATTVDTFVGHNIAAFDLEVIKKRAIILGVPVPTVFRHALRAKPWDGIIFDTMLKWDAKNPASLDKICRALGIEGKGEINGSHVWQLYKSGDYEALANYCRSDVEKTRLVYERMSKCL